MRRFELHLYLHVFFGAMAAFGNMAGLLNFLELSSLLVVLDHAELTSFPHSAAWWRFVMHFANYGIASCFLSTYFWLLLVDV